ncbi:hypothetical protein [Paenibacillus lutrae]|uniref:Uncharacterized protein n=1 Tax=Paenibacillus lutrae TaxID=2078573 RepID=A0A7X3FKI2_9BACL|nr:hypothetical protein [Paenibacillus lutrae]MVP01022.1 hypothetical protein [Paenibacillus lutrae]
MELYFAENFFSTGKRPIMNSDGSHAGTLDMKSLFSSSIDIYNQDERKVCGGSFRFLSFSGKWEVTDGLGTTLGVLRPKFKLFSKKYEYDAGPRGLYEITSPMFSKHYLILDSYGEHAAEFEQTNGWLQSGAFRLRNESSQLGNFELVAVIMGIHETQRRNNQTGSTANSTTYTPNM